MDQPQVLPVLFWQSPFFPMSTNMSTKVDGVNLKTLKHVIAGNLKRGTKIEKFLTRTIVIVLCEKLPTNRTSLKVLMKNIQKDYNSIAVLAEILSCEVDEEGDVEIKIKGKDKVEIVEFTTKTPLYRVRYLMSSEYGFQTKKADLLMESLKGSVEGMVKANLLNKAWIDFCTKPYVNIPFFVDSLIVFMQVNHQAFELEQLRALFVTLNITEKMVELYHAMENSLIGFESEAVKAKEIRNVMLRRKKAHLQAELNKESGDEDDAVIDEFNDRIEAAEMPEEVYTVAMKELRKLAETNSQSPEYTVTHEYLSWLCDTPWNKRTEDDLNPKRVRRVLDEDHYDLEKPKERIVEHIAVRKIAPKLRFPILLIVGPPGIGKTSLAMSLSRATKKVLCRKALGGVRDEAEIRGHRRTYVGARPGFIIAGLCKAGFKNIIYVLDEIDKMGADFRGDPGAALLEVMDPEVNTEFSDHYLEVPFDLSEVMFVLTGNDLDAVPLTLRDRCFVIELEGYTPDQKCFIARDFLVPEQVEESGLNNKEFVKTKIEFTHESLLAIIKHYTREGGVRELKRKLGSICADLAVKVVEGRPMEEKTKITPSSVKSVLGPHIYSSSDKIEIDEPGVGIGLAWTPYGGGLLVIGSRKMPGKGKLLVTGSAKDVMQESAEVAFTVAQNYLERQGKDLSFLRKTDIHIQFERGKIGKDGPSAGGLMAVIFVSLLTDRLIRSDSAMTGELCFREEGKILPIGGLKTKLVAAHQSELKQILIPSLNTADLPEVPDQVKQEMDIIPVLNVPEAVKRLLL